MKKRKGYWLGKKKDQHTLDRLSESKHKEVLEYNVDGTLVKIWGSIKSVAVDVFKDYRIINGGSKSKIYRVLKNKRCSNKKAFNNDTWRYWFSVEEILSIYGNIPQRINFSDIDSYYTNQLIESRKGRKLYQKCYTIIEYNDNGIVNNFDNIKDASTMLEMHSSYIGKCCRTKKPLSNGNFVKYGEKTISFIKKY